MKRIALYVVGLFFLAIGIAFSIQAALGVSPVSSLAYAFALVTGMSVGLMTVVANMIFIIMQVIFTKKINLREFGLQLLVAFLFGFYMDFALFLVRLLPTPETIFMRSIFLIISLFIVGIGLLGYFNAKLPLMPYDALTYAISDKFQMPFPKAKITSDLINVCLSLVICLIFIHSFGSVGIGTLIAAYFIGKILGVLMKRYKDLLQDWINRNGHEESTTEV
ncbi:YczE/YyaS/YitT family protein [Ureibacillus xyleni]